MSISLRFFKFAEQFFHHFCGLKPVCLRLNKKLLNALENGPEASSAASLLNLLVFRKTRFFGYLAGRSWRRRC